jgi:hypothetical protein
MNSNVAQTIFSKGTLFDLDIGRWGAIKKMSANDMLLEDLDKDVLYPGHKKLLPKKATKILVEIEGKARLALAQHSIPFPIAGARFVNFSSLPTVNKKLKALQTEFTAAVEDLVKKYEGLRDGQIQILDEQASKFMQRKLQAISLRSDLTPEVQAQQKAVLEEWLCSQNREHRKMYPAVDQLASKYRFSWRVFKLSPLDQASAVDADALADFQEKYNKDMEEWAKEATKMMHKALGEAAAQAKNMLEKHDKLNPKNLKPLFQAFETFKSVDFTGKSSFQGVIENLKKKYSGSLETTAEAINSTEEGKNEFSELLGAIGQLALEQTAEQAGIDALQNSDFGRVIDLH